MNEEWRAVIGYPMYEVSSHGKVRKANGRPVSVYENNGYLLVTLTRDKTSRSRLIHHLVLEAFAGPRPRGLIGLHNNDDKLNNRADNLRWGTYKDNIEDARRNGRFVRMDPDKVRALRQSTKSDAELAREHNLSEIAVFNARLRVTYRNVV